MDLINKSTENIFFVENLSRMSVFSTEMIRLIKSSLVTFITFAILLHMCLAIVSLFFFCIQYLMNVLTISEIHIHLRKVLEKMSSRLYPPWIDQFFACFPFWCLTRLIDGRFTKQQQNTMFKKKTFPSAGLREHKSKPYTYNRTQ